MPARRLALLAALVVPVFLAACDSGAGASTITGVWEGTATFQADTLLPDYNARVIADYEMAFRFELMEDDGLVTGRILATGTGQRIVREAGPGFPTDTARFTGATTIVDTLFGTFVAPTLEVDVPEGTYEEDLWTFSVTGNHAKIARYLISTNHITLSNGEEFDLDLNSDGFFEMDQISDEVPESVRPAVARALQSAASGLSLPRPAPATRR
ncbi:MAG TPA: hypothetical protein VK610_09270 [Rhodothermales bacterium]|nr:hypothetical protein [Rhodothermales bacterium]